MNVEQGRAIAAQKAAKHYQAAEEQLALAREEQQGRDAEMMHLQYAQVHASLALCNMISAGFSRS